MPHKKNSLLITIIIFIVCHSACSKDDNPPNNNPPIEKPQEKDVPFDEVITIPIVVHVVNYKPDPFTISDEKIKSQIYVLNQDFRKKNPDHLKTPDEFSHLVADVGIEFKLADTDPNGNATTGIIRTESDVIASDGHSIEGDTPITELRLYFTDKGGQDAWPNDKYLNIWIADYSTSNGRLTLPGYANPPGSDPRIDGVVMDPRVFGMLPPLHPAHKFGRTATHEIGHWLNLLHIYAGQRKCDSSDLVDDTPTQYESYSGNPTHPRKSCGSNDMFMNFMDYVNDESMYMFTIGQKKRMRDLFNPDGLRRKLYLNNKSKSN
ncbi:M43 family zinc metalloprotease [Flavivirga eckloniae]|uniref:Zinc metalloprotease n=1 Tax=Flavivirga eckloniae TaxID=1803846 RepID=A0A2K9PP85_9FLAO|nr:M43 family zinc metalloprotease [Flavivirga eckloniae]AUP78628.1 zinc metalloprotease [Flavivirga eckloniae]